LTVASPIRPRSTRRTPSIDSLIEADARRVQLRLPFPDEKTIDMDRCCSILRVSPWVVRRLSVTPLRPGSEVMSLSTYNTMRSAPLRIDYDSLVRFVDELRRRHGIADRREAPLYGRHRDDDLLPFPWIDTMTIAEASDSLNIHRSKVLIRIESGLFEAYQIAHNSDWRISRNSFAEYLRKVSSIPSRPRPYGG
jgi:excisionase family DNA binding protein